MAATTRTAAPLDPDRTICATCSRRSGCPELGAYCTSCSDFEPPDPRPRACHVSGKLRILPHTCEEDEIGTLALMDLIAVENRLSGDHAEDGRYAWPQRWEALRNAALYGLKGEPHVR